MVCCRDAEHQCPRSMGPKPGTIVPPSASGAALAAPTRPTVVSVGNRAPDAPPWRVYAASRTRHVMRTFRTPHVSIVRRRRPVPDHGILKLFCALAMSVAATACYHRVVPRGLVIPAGAFVFRGPEPLCRGVQKHGYTFVAPIGRINELTGQLDPAVPDGTRAVFQVDHYDEGSHPMVYLIVQALIVHGQRIPVSGARANSDAESAAAPEGAPVCTSVGSRFFGDFIRDVVVK